MSASGVNDTNGDVIEVVEARDRKSGSVRALVFRGLQVLEPQQSWVHSDKGWRPGQRKYSRDLCKGMGLNWHSGLSTGILPHFAPGFRERACEVSICFDVFGLSPAGCKAASSLDGCCYCRGDGGKLDDTSHVQKVESA